MFLKQPETLQQTCIMHLSQGICYTHFAYKIKWQVWFLSTVASCAWQCARSCTRGLRITTRTCHLVSSISNDSFSQARLHTQAHERTHKYHVHMHDYTTTSSKLLQRYVIQIMLLCKYLLCSTIKKYLDIKSSNQWISWRIFQCPVIKKRHFEFLLNY